MNDISKKIEAFKKLMNGKKRIEYIDPENEYKKLSEMLDGEIISTGSNRAGFINPFETEVDENDRKEIISNFKELLSQHYKFASKFKEKNISMSDIKEICVKNDFDITDEELLKIIYECKRM